MSWAARLSGDSPGAANLLPAAPDNTNQPHLVGKSSNMQGPEENVRSNSVLNLASLIVY